MKQADAQKIVRHLCEEWAEERGTTIPPETQPSYPEFRAWVEANRASSITFLVRAGVGHMVEMWFNQELKRTRLN